MKIHKIPYTAMKLTIVGLLSVVLLAIFSACMGGVGPISEVDCKSFANDFEGRTLKNAFGAENEILKIRDPIEVSRSEKELVCRGKGVTEFGDMDLRITLSEDSDGEQWWAINVIP